MGIKLQLMDGLYRWIVFGIRKWPTAGSNKCDSKSVVNTSGPMELIVVCLHFKPAFVVCVVNICEQLYRVELFMKRLVTNVSENDCSKDLVLSEVAKGIPLSSLRAEPPGVQQVS